MKLSYFRHARDCSLKSDYVGNASIGCVAVFKNAIIAKGWNQEKTHTMQKRYNRYRDFKKNFPLDKVHAEINCISKIRYLDIDFSKVTLYIYRELSDGTISCAKPCESCMRAIKELGIRHICYTVHDGYEEVKFIPFN